MNNFHTGRLLMKGSTTLLLAPNESGELFGRKITKHLRANFRPDRLGLKSFELNDLKGYRTVYEVSCAWLTSHTLL